MLNWLLYLAHNEITERPDFVRIHNYVEKVLVLVLIVLVCLMPNLYFCASKTMHYEIHKENS